MDDANSLTSKISDLKRFSEDKKSLLPTSGKDNAYYEMNTSTSSLLAPIEMIHSQRLAAATGTIGPAEDKEQEKGGKEGEKKKK